jgi:hypothetical protein
VSGDLLDRVGGGGWTMLCQCVRFSTVSKHDPCVATFLTVSD